MKMFLISDNVDTQTGMRLAGVEGVVVHEREELYDTLQKTLADKEIGIILLTEKFVKATTVTVTKSNCASTISFRCSLKFRTVTVPEERRTLSLPL